MYLHALENGRETRWQIIANPLGCSGSTLPDLALLMPAVNYLCRLPSIRSDFGLFGGTTTPFFSAQRFLCSNAFFYFLVFLLMCVFPEPLRVGDCLFLSSVFKGLHHRTKKTRGILDLTSLEKS